MFERNNAYKTAEVAKLEALKLEYRSTVQLRQRAEAELPTDQRANTAVNNQQKLKGKLMETWEQFAGAGKKVARTFVSEVVDGIKGIGAGLQASYAAVGVQKAENARITKGWASAAKTSKDAMEGKTTMFGMTVPNKVAEHHKAPTSFHGIADFSKQIQMGLNQKDKEVAKNTAELVKHAKTLVDQANKKISKGNKKEAAHHPPRMG